LKPKIQFQPLRRWMAKVSPVWLLTKSNYPLFR
jgi:hypothetical protein